MRRVIADRLTRSWTSPPHFTITVAVDVTAVLALRTELRAAGTNLTVTDFVLAAAAQTLAEFPDVNARTDGLSVWPRRRVHLGLAVSVAGGLVVPVIRNADRLPLADLVRHRSELVQRARAGKSLPQDFDGGAFTLSNLGGFRVDSFDAILNPPQATILAVGRILERPFVEDGQVRAVPTMKLSLSVDHRVLDGAAGARFLDKIIGLIEAPTQALS